MANGIPSDYLRLSPSSLATPSTSDPPSDDDNNTYHYALDINEVTISVPYFAILQVGKDPVIHSHNSSSPRSSSSTKSLPPPPTIINDGRHAQLLSKLLTNHGLSVMIVKKGVKDVDKAAMQKLLWVSIMWLLCHDNYDTNSNNDKSKLQLLPSPITVKKVHEQRSQDVRMLVKELIPMVNLLWNKYHPHNNDDATILGNIEDVITTMEAYSYSMPDTIPKKKIAIDEFGQRNGLLLSIEAEDEKEKEEEGDESFGTFVYTAAGAVLSSSLRRQDMHRDLIVRVVGYIPGDK